MIDKGSQLIPLYLIMELLSIYSFSFSVKFIFLYEEPFCELITQLFDNVTISLAGIDEYDFSIIS